MGNILPTHQIIWDIGYRNNEVPEKYDGRMRAEEDDQGGGRDWRSHL